MDTDKILTSIGIFCCGIIIFIFGFVIYCCYTKENRVDVAVDINNNNNNITECYGKFIEINNNENNLAYDFVIKIVYIKFYIYCSDDYIYTPYYASNGLPYRYNSETNILEEINN